MSDDQQPPTLRALADDLPPLPDEVWERTLSVAFDPDTVVDADLVPEQDALPIVPDDEIDLVDLDAADLGAIGLGDVDLDDGVLLDDTDTPDDDPSDHGGVHEDSNESIDGVSGDDPSIDLGAELGDADPAEHFRHDAHSAHDPGHDPDVYPGNDLL